MFPNPLQWVPQLSQSTKEATRRFFWNDNFTSIHDRRPKVDALVNNATIIHRETERKR